MTSKARNYRAGTREALVLLSRGTCYFPDCQVSVMEMTEGHPLMNVDFAHVYAAESGGPYHDEEMSDDERRHFDNLILLCRRHHTLVDTREPEKYPPEVRLEWKRQREAGGLEALRGLSSLTEDRLAEMLEEAVASAQPRRDVVVELSPALLDGSSLLALPFDGIETLLERNPGLADLDRVMVVTVRNVGFVPLTVESFHLRLLSGDETAGVLMARNDFPLLNPTCPVSVDAGAAAGRWLVALGTVSLVIRQCIDERRAPTDLVGEAALASGETIQSARLGIETLPIWKSEHHDEFAAQVRRIRAARSTTGDTPESDSPIADGSSDPGVEPASDLDATDS